jgi:conjugative transfer signal peptidase TraF
MDTPERLYPTRSGAAVRAGVGANEEEVRGSASVVRQDKGSGSQWPVGPLFLRPSDDFRTGHCELTEVRVTRARWVAPSHLQNSLAVLAVTLTGAMMLVLGGRLLQIRIILTDSAARAGTYRLITAPAIRGALVAACLPAAAARTGLMRGYLQTGDCPGGAEPVAKVLGALPGDVVQVEPGGVAVNGVAFASSQTATRDSAGRPLAHVPWGVRRVNPGEVWLFGFNNRRSWDARYFGAAPLAAVRGVLRPVVTW